MDFQFRTVINKENTQELAERIANNYAKFDSDSFIYFIHQKIDDLNYGDRIKLVREAIEKYLPKDYEQTLNILLNSLTDELTTPEISGFEGFINLPIGSYVAKNGLHNFDLSMNALYELTKRFSSESDIRPFIEKYPQESLKILKKWAKDENVHVRRLVSEGSRPRLPLGKRLQMFVNDPTPIIELLDLLKDYPQLYVRRSVANNLNDIAKDNPTIVTDTLKKWNKEIKSENMQWLTKHALRTLIKTGNEDALNILGYNKDVVIVVDYLRIINSEIKIGDKLIFEFEVSSDINKEQNLMIDYEIHYMKANGKLQAKTFKLSQKVIKNNTIHLMKKHSFQEMTTRKHYPGKHLLKIKINGEIYAAADFEVKN